MAWYSSVVDTLSDYGRSKLRQIESLFAKGLGAQQANHVVKETSSLSPDERRGLVPWEAYQLWKEFQSAKEASNASFPTRRSERLYVSDAVPMHFVSPMQHRYLLDYTFTMRNPVTGELIEQTSTMGFRRLGRWGSILDRLNERIAQMSEVAERGENYMLLQKLEYVEGSIQVAGFYRTLNN